MENDEFNDYWIKVILETWRGKKEIPFSDQLTLTSATANDPPCSYYSSLSHVILNTVATFAEHLKVCVNPASGLVIGGIGCNKHAVQTYLTEKHLHIIFSAEAVAYSLLSKF